MNHSGSFSRCASKTFNSGSRDNQLIPQVFIRETKESKQSGLYPYNSAYIANIVMKLVFNRESNDGSERMERPSGVRDSCART